MQTPNTKISFYAPKSDESYFSAYGAVGKKDQINNASSAKIVRNMLLMGVMYPSPSVACSMLERCFLSTISGVRVSFKLKVGEKFLYLETANGRELCWGEVEDFIKNRFGKPTSVRYVKNIFELPPSAAAEALRYERELVKSAITEPMKKKFGRDADDKILEMVSCLIRDFSNSEGVQEATNRAKSSIERYCLANVADEEFQAQIGVFGSFLGVDNTVERMKILLDEATDTAEHLLWNFALLSLSIGVFLTGIARGNTKLTCGGAIATSIVLATTAPSEKTQPLISWLQSYFTPGKAQAQSTELLPGVLSILFYAVQHLTTKKDDISFSLKDFNALVSSFPRLSSGFEEIGSWVKNALTTILSYLEERIMGETGKIFPTDTNHELRKLVREVEEFNKEYLLGSMVLNYANGTRLVTLQRKLRKMLLECNRASQSGVRSIVTSSLHVLERIEDPFKAACIVNSPIRMRPLTILINGGTGAGKTYLTIPLIQEMVMRTIDESQMNSVCTNMQDFVYSREQEHEYWDGYRNQFCVVFDDFGQTRDVPGKMDNEYMDLIRCCSSYQHMLHMSNLSEKGRVSFQSNMIVATSNLKDFSGLKSLTCTEAVERRFDIKVTVCPKEEFCTDATAKEPNPWDRRLDVNKAGNSRLSGEFNSDVYEFHVFEFRPHGANHRWESQYTGKVMDYESFIELVHEKYKHRVIEFENYSASLAKRRDKCTDFSSQGASVSRNLHEEAVGGWPSQSVFEENEPIVGENVDWYEHMLGGELFEVQRALEERNVPYTAVEFLELTKDLVDVGWYSSPIEYVDACIDIVPDLLLSDSNEFVPRIRYRSVKYQVKFREYTKKLGEFMAWLDSKRKEVLNKYPLLEIAKKVLTTLSKVWSLVVLLGTAFGLYKYWTGDITFTKEDVMEFDKSGNVVPKEKQGVSEGVKLSSTMSSEEWRDKISQLDDIGRAELLRLMQLGSRSDDLKKAFESEGGFDSALDSIMYKIMNNNQYSMHINGAKAGYVTFVKDRVAIMPWHFCSSVANDVPETIKLVSVNGRIRYVFPGEILVSNSKRIGDLDLAVVIFPLKMRCHSNIMKFFQPKYDSMVVERDFNIRLSLMEDSKLRTYNSPARWFGTAKINTVHGNCVVENTLLYRANTKSGDCGALLALEDPSVNLHKIVGFHIAGMADGRAIATVLSQDLLDSYITSIDAVEYEFKELLPSDRDIDGPFITQGRVMKGVSVPNKTKIVPGLFHGKLCDITTAPACLRSKWIDGELINPVDLGLKKYDGPVLMFDTRALRIARTTLFSMLINRSKVPCEVKIYDFDTAVLGIPGEKYCDAIPRGTSCGYPYNTYIPPSYPGKTYFFGKDVEYDLNNSHCDELRARCHEIVENAKRGIRMFHVFADYMKDERRPIEKVKACKTRLIFASPVCYLIVTRMYFMAFARWIMLNRIDNGVAVGTNPYTEWDYLARTLLANSTKFVAGDFSGFDGSQVADILWEIYELIESWYQLHGGSEEDRRVRYILWHEVVNSHHISGDTIYEWCRSLPSGHPLTTIINSLYNQILFRLSWFEYSGRDYKSFTSFDDNVRLVTYGDDGVCTVKETHPLFNQNSIPGFMQVFGATWTHESKEAGDHEDFREITQVDFLKRSFRYEELYGCYLAPLALPSVLEPCCWTKVGPREMLIQCSNVDGALRELPLHGRETFERWKKPLLALSVELLEYVPQITEFEDALEFTMNSEYIY